MADTTLNDLGFTPAVPGADPVMPNFTPAAPMIVPDPVADIAKGENVKALKTLRKGAGPVAAPETGPGYDPAQDAVQPTIQEATPEQVVAARDVNQSAEHPEDMASLGPLEQGLVATQAVMQKAEAKTVEGSNALFAPVAAMARFVSNKSGLPYPEIVDQIERSSEYWARSLSNKISYSDYMTVVAGNVLGSAPEVIQYMMGPTWAMLRAASESDQDLTGTILAGAERRAVGQVFHGLGKVDAAGRIAGMTGVMTAQGMSQEYASTGRVTLENTATGFGTGLGMALSGGFGPGDKSGMRQRLNPETWVAFDAKGAELDRALEAKQIDQPTYDLAYRFLANDLAQGGTALNDTSLKITDQVNLIRKGVDDWILRTEGIDPQAEPDRVYKITGKTATRRDAEGNYAAAIELYQGHNTGTLVEEWMHRQYDLLPASDRQAITRAYGAYVKGLGEGVQPMNEGEFYAKGATDKFFADEVAAKRAADRPAWLKVVDEAKTRWDGLVATVKGLPGAQEQQPAPAGQPAMSFQAGGEQFQAAYHGSPYRFDKFTLDHIGSGEGAQAYGYGLYFASNRSVAEYYREGLANSQRGGLSLAGVVPSSPNEGLSDRGWVSSKKLSDLLVPDSQGVKAFGDLDVKGRANVLSVVNDLLQEPKILDAVVRLIPVDVVNMLAGKEYSSEYLLNHPTVLVHLLPADPNNLVPGHVQAMNALAPAVALAAAKVHTGLGRFDVSPSDFLAANRTLHDSPPVSISSKIPQPSEFVKGQLYEVTIPDDHTMLDWDKPLSEQPEGVRKAFKAGMDAKGVESYKTAEGEYVYLDFGSESAMRGQDVYRSLAGEMGGMQAASEYLKSIGIPGLRYLDGTSRGKGEGHHNYVVFDDAQIAIDKTYYQVRPTSDLIFDAMDPHGEGQKYSTGGNTNFTKLDTVDKILDLIDNQSKINAENGEFARVTRGTRTHEQTIAEAQKPETIASVLALKPGEAGNAEQGLAARMLRNDSAAALVESIENLSTEDFLKSYRAFTGLVLIDNALAAESGRAQEARNIVVGSAESQAIAEALAKITEKIQDPKAFAQMIKGFRGTDGKVDVNALSKFAKDIAERDSTTGEKLFEIWINSLLMMPSTHAANIIGNSVTAAWAVPERALAGAIGSVREGVGELFGRAKTGDRVAAGEFIAHLHGTFEGFRDGFKLAGDAWKTGNFGESIGKVETSHMRAVTAEQLGMDPKNPMGKMVDFLADNVLRGPTRALATADEFFKAIGYRAEIRAQAWRQASAENLEGKAFEDRYAELVNNPGDKISLAATDAAAYQTFTNDLGDWGTKFMGLKKLTKTVDVDGQPVVVTSPLGLTTSVIVPFAKTPANIVKYGLERTPLAFALYGKDMAGGGAKADLAIARVTLGSMLGGLAAQLAAQGIVTGSGPRDPAQQENLKQVGWLPYAIRIGDTYYSYKRFDPLSKVIGMAADFATMSEWMNESEKEDLAGLIAVSFANNVLDSTFMVGVHKFFDAASDPQRYGEKYIQAGLAGFQPAAGATRLLRNIEDPFVRETETILDRFANQNPGASLSLYPKLDRYGREIETGKFWLAMQGISPIQTEEKHNDQNSETYQIDKVIRENHVSIPRIDHNFHHENVYVRLTGEEYNRLGKIAGEELGLIDKLNRVVLSGQFQNSSNGPDGTKARAITNVFHQVRQDAKDKLLRMSIGEPGGLAERLADAKIAAKERQMNERPEDQ